VAIVFDQFTDLVVEASGWAYGIIFVLAALDALVPLVPAETSVITAGVVASSGDLVLGLVIVAAAAGAAAGDNATYWVGKRYGRRLRERRMTGEKAQRRIAWADRQLKQRGGELIAVGRFIPGGRTAVCLSAGTLGYPWRRFVLFDALAAVGWALYAAFLGYFGGRAFEEEWKGLLLAVGIATAVAAAIEVVRWFRHRRQRRSG
jgi:membrane-associated protein